MKKFFISAMLFFCLAAITACGGKSSSTTETVATEEKHEDEQENPNTATLTVEQMKSIGVELGVIEDKELTSSLKANGLQLKANSPSSLYRITITHQQYRNYNGNNSKNNCGDRFFVYAFPFF